MHCRNTSGIMHQPYSRFSMVGVLQSYDVMGPDFIGQKNFYPEMRADQEQEHQLLR